MEYCKGELIGNMANDLATGSYAGIVPDLVGEKGRRLSCLGVSDFGYIAAASC